VIARLSGNDDNAATKTFELPWNEKEKAAPTRIEANHTGKPDQNLLRSVMRSHAWLSELSNGTHASIESLATAEKLHPKVIRQALRLAFLAPEITESILQSNQPGHLSLAAIPFALPLRWTEQRQALNAAS
jgi:site-specific DNA recombinase